MDFFDMVQGQQSPAPQGPSPQGGIAGLLDNSLSTVMTAPPTTPQEQMQRRQSWSEVLANPNMKSALLRMGLQMMRGTRPGESALGATARAGIGAMDYYAAKQDLDRRRGMDQQKLDLDKRNTESQIQSRTVQSAGQMQDMQQSQAKFSEWTSQSDMRRKTAEEQYNNLVRDGKVDEARLVNEKFKSEEAQAKADFMRANPNLRDQAMRDELMRPTAELEQTRAQTAASRASASNAAANAAESRAKLGILQEDKANMPAWIRALPDKEAQMYAQANKGSKTQTQIMSDIGLGKHHGLIDDQRAGGDDAVGYQGMAQSIVERYRSDPRGKKSGMSLDQYVAENYNVTLGKSAGTVLSLAKQIEGTSASMPAGETVVRGKDGKLMIQK